jgi:hypothetical protein
VRRQALAGLCGLVAVGIVVGAWQAAEVGYVASPVGPPEDLAELADLSQVQLLEPGVAEAPGAGGSGGVAVLGATEDRPAPVVLVLGGHDGLVLGAGLRSAGALDVVIGATEDCVLPDGCAATATWPDLVDRFAPDLVLLHLGDSGTIDGLDELAGSLTAGGADLVVVTPTGAPVVPGLDAVGPAAVVDRIAVLLAAHANP